MTYKYLHVASASKYKELGHYYPCSYNKIKSEQNNS